MQEQSALANPVFVAIDRQDLAGARDLASRLQGLVGGLKLGLEFFTANGPDGVAAIARLGLPIFLDLKFHDIPNTVAGAVRAAAGLGVAIVNVHAAGGPAMLEAARRAAGDGPDRPRIIAVTVLTSLDAGDLAAAGVTAQPLDQVIRLSRLAAGHGLDGVVCSPLELHAVREACGSDFLTVVPGIRPAGHGRSDDQKRTMTPAEARRAGADILVIGRPVTGADDPGAAAGSIMVELGLRAAA